MQALLAVAVTDGRSVATVHFHNVRPVSRPMWNAVFSMMIDKSAHIQSRKSANSNPSSPANRRGRRYVQGLETRVKELEKQLSAALVSSPYPNLHPDHDFDQPIINFATPPDTDNSDTFPFATPPSHSRSDFLVDELKRLSLEAAAERHLGSSSGLSFAKLTQAVLRRLSPDKAEFVFDDTPDESTEQYDGPLSDPLLDASTSLWELNNSFSSPCLFNQLPLSHVMEDETTLADLQFPDRAHIEYLMEFYFAHSHTLYPIIRQTEFASVIWRVYNNPQDHLAGSALWMFRIWMVLAIGSTTHCSVTLGDESESILYYNRAMVYFEDALGLGDMVCHGPPPVTKSID